MSELISKLKSKLAQLNYNEANKLNCEEQKILLSYKDTDGETRSGYIKNIWIDSLGEINATLMLKDPTTEMIGIEILFSSDDIQNIENIYELLNNIFCNDAFNKIPVIGVTKDFKLKFGGNTNNIDRVNANKPFKLKFDNGITLLSKYISPTLTVINLDNFDFDVDGLCVLINWGEDNIVYVKEIKELTLEKECILDKMLGLYKVIEIE